MKKYVLLIVLGCCVSLARAQLVNQAAQNQKSQAELDWYNCSPEEDGVYGAAVNKAYDFLKGKKLDKCPVVAFVGFGLDVEHEDLKEAVWTNKREKADGKDNDKNGLVDDVHGWNYLGGKDGQVLEIGTWEGNREYMRLKDKYADYISSNGEFFKIVNEEVVKVDAPENLEEFYYYRNVVQQQSGLARAYAGWQYAYVIQSFGRKWKAEMDAKYPGRKHTIKDFAEEYQGIDMQDTLRLAAYSMIIFGSSVYKTSDFEVIYNNFVENSVNMSKNGYETAESTTDMTARQRVVGDNYLDINDNVYGNNVLLTSDAAIGTMAAGIVGGKRGNGLGGDGIMDQAEIMTLRVDVGQGNPCLKDMALSIRYAVDHGADVIVLSQQNTLYPDNQKGWMTEALRYAEKAGVLVIVPVWELSQDLAQVTYYPNRWMDGEKELTNLMVVASSDKNGNPSMQANFGAKEVDLFAPGVDIYTAYTGDTYQTGAGSGLATATVAGVAALVKAYYPELTGAQIRDILLQSVTSRKDAEVEKGIVVGNSQMQDLYLFQDLCLSGGILNAYNAVVAADKLVNNK